MSQRPDPKYPLWSEMPEPPIGSVVEDHDGCAYERDAQSWFFTSAHPAGRNTYTWRDLCMTHGPFRLIASGAPTHGQQCNDGLPRSPQDTHNCVTSPLWHAVEEAIHAALVRITAPESVGVSLRATAGLLAGTIASLVGVAEDRPASEDVATELRPEPEWLTSLRKDMAVAVLDLWNGSDSAQSITDRAVGVAASYLHPLYRDLANLREDYEGSETRVAELAENDKRVNALKAQVARREATISAYETALTESHDRTEQLERERVGRAPDGPALQYLPLSEVTDGHVAAYRKAYLAEARKFNEAPAPIELDQCIRAGLAAIQWPSREVPATPETRKVSTEEAVIAYVKLVAESLYRRLDGVTNQVRVLVESMPVAAPPEMRGLPVNGFHELRPGDLLSGIWSEYGPKSDVPAMPFAESGSGWLINPVVTRPASPLPTSGQVAYEAARTERLARRRSDEVIGWDELDDGIRGMWEAAAQAVIDNQPARPVEDREPAGPYAPTRVGVPLSLAESAVLSALSDLIVNQSARISSSVDKLTEHERFSQNAITNKMNALIDVLGGRFDRIDTALTDLLTGDMTAGGEPLVTKAFAVAEFERGRQQGDADRAQRLERTEHPTRPGAGGR